VATFQNLLLFLQLCGRGICKTRHDLLHLRSGGPWFAPWCCGGRAPGGLLNEETRCATVLAATNKRRTTAGTLRARVGGLHFAAVALLLFACFSRLNLTRHAAPAMVISDAFLFAKRWLRVRSRWCCQALRSCYRRAAKHACLTCAPDTGCKHLHSIVPASDDSTKCAVGTTFTRHIMPLCAALCFAPA